MHLTSHQLAGVLTRGGKSNSFVGNELWNKISEAENQQFDCWSKQRDVILEANYYPRTYFNSKNTNITINPNATIVLQCNYRLKCYHPRTGFNSPTNSNITSPKASKLTQLMLQKLTSCLIVSDAEAIALLIF